MNQQDCRFNNRKLIYILTAILFVTQLVACGCQTAVNRTENFSYAWPNISYEAKNNITVGVVDQRPYIVNGNNEATYIGLMRGGFYNPWYMNTESGEPLANDLTQAVVSGYKNSGFDVRSVDLTCAMQQKELLTNLLSINTARNILININEWKSDTYKTIVFLYDITVEIYDNKGVMLAQASEKNIDDKGEEQMVSDTISAGRSVLEKVLNNQLVINALE